MEGTMSLPCILLDKVNPMVSSGSTGKEITPFLWREEMETHMAKGMDTGRGEDSRSFIQAVLLLFPLTVLVRYHSQIIQFTYLKSIVH